MNEINFLTNEMKKHQNRQHALLVNSLILAAGILILTIMFYVPAVLFKASDNQKNILKQRYTDFIIQSNIISIHNKEAQSKQNIINLHRRIIGDEIKNISKCSIEGLILDEIKYDTDEIMIKGKSSNFFLIPEFENNIEKSGMYKSVKISEIELQGNDVDYVFNMCIKPKE